MLTWAETIRTAAKQSGLNTLAISKRSGVGYGRVHEFLIAGGGARLDNAERIARVVGLELRPKRKGSRD